MYHIYLFMAVLAGVFIRVLDMEGFFVLPCIDKAGRLRLNTLGTVLVGLAVVYVLMEQTPWQVTTHLQAFAFAYLAPLAVDKVGKLFSNDTSA